MRCTVCDYCPETDGGNREMIYLRKEQGYVCDHCSDSIASAIADFRPEVDEAELERIALLEELEMAED